MMVAAAVLIVTCPCALSLATPVAMLTAAGHLAKHGVLVQNLSALEALAEVDTVIFDKTGTLSEDRLSIQGIRAEVKRPAAVRATLPQLDGSVLLVETDGLLARALQHEIDHLNGVLFVDRLSPVAKVSMKNRLKRLLDAGGKA